MAVLSPDSPSRLRRNQHGYSIFELVVVVIIIGIITTIAMQSMRPSVDTARIEETKQEMDQIAFAIAGDPEKVSGGMRTDFGYVGDVGSLPANLAALQSNPGSYSTWRGPYLKDEFSDGSSSNYQVDAWGATYAYTGGVTIASTGSGSSITRNVATSTSDLLNNTVFAVVTDIDASPPGPLNADSVRFILSYPDGTGGMTSQSRFPGADGSAQFANVPIGVHDLQLVYLPTNDTLTRRISVLPGELTSSEIQYPENIWRDSVSTGGSGTSGVLTIRPSGIGSFSNLLDENCSPQWQCVDEVTPDEDATYVKGDALTFKTDTYLADNHTTESGVIDSVIVYMRIQGASSGKKARTTIITHGTQYDGTDIILSSVSTFANYSTTYVTNPFTGGAWSWSEIDNLEIGVSIRKEGFCTQVWADIYYTY
jgi:prepilin-type N-terminal cleavage/methylation domain-containing protein